MLLLHHSSVEKLIHHLFLLISDDIVYTSLNPSQSFKSTILAGMSPMVIHDVCGRALGFWTYQVAQEATFQNMILKDAQEVRVCRLCF